MSLTKPKAKRSALAAATTSHTLVSPAQFAGLMQEAGSFDNASSFAVGVSGGADSMALLLLAHNYAISIDANITALTVDHGLRPESAAEAEQVARWCAKLGIPHQTLLWKLPSAPQSAIQEAARNARYALMAEYCEAHGISQLLVAHHQGDQAETLFFRLARGSLLDGLACMQPAKALTAKVQLLRPLLPVSKARLVATLKAQDQPWVEDPSNHNMAYTRPHIRAQLAACENREDILQRAYEVTKAFSHFRAILEKQAETKLAACISTQDKYSLTLSADAFSALEPEYGLRALASISLRVGGKQRKPRTEKLERFYLQTREDIASKSTKKRSFAGCLFAFKPKSDSILVTPERNAAS